MKTRNYTIDYIKILAAFAVVMIHTTDFNQTLNLINLDPLNDVFRFAVPFFIISSGYFVKDNYKSLVGIVKLYTLTIVTYGLLGVFNLPRTMFIQWYLPAMMVILVLTNNRNKYWTSSLIFASLAFDLLTGRFLVIGPIIETSVRSNFITFLWVFILGRYIREHNIKFKSKAINILLLIIAGLLCYLNILIEGQQYYILAKLTAVIIFIASFGFYSYLPRIFRNLSLDLFLYHWIFLPLKPYFTIDSYINFFKYYFVVCILAVCLGVFVRSIDRKFFNNTFY